MAFKTIATSTISSKTACQLNIQKNAALGPSISRKCTVLGQSISIKCTVLGRSISTKCTVLGLSISIKWPVLGLSIIIKSRSVTSRTNASVIHCYACCLSVLVVNRLHALYILCDNLSQNTICSFMPFLLYLSASSYLLRWSVTAAKNNSIICIFPDSVSSTEHLSKL